MKALKAQENELEAITQRVKDEVEAIAGATVEKLREMNPELASQLKPRFSKPKWASVFKVSLTGDNDIPMNKRGSGVRRLILLNFFRAKAERVARDKGRSNVIYAIEEPETSQHPNNQRMLMDAFSELSADPDCQVLLTTHTPTLARMVPVDHLRYIEVCDDNQCRLIRCCGTDDAICQKIVDDLGILPDHDVKLFWGVEGINDENFFVGISRMLKNHGENVPDLEQLITDNHLVFIPLGGRNLAHWVSRLASLNRPEFYIFDRGAAPPEVSEYQGQADEFDRQPNATASLTSKREIENYLHADAIRAARSGIEVTFDDFDDLPEMVAKKVHEQGGSPTEWDALTEENKGKKESRAKKWLNTDAVAAMTPTLLDERDPDGEIRGWLASIANIIAGPPND